MLRTWTSRSFLLLGGLAAVACTPESDDTKITAGQGLSAQAVSERTGRIAGAIARDAATAFVAIGELSTLQNALESFGSAAETFAGPPELPPPPPDQCETEPCEPTSGSSIDPEELEAELRAYLEETIFAPDNLESSDATSATFLLAGADLCPTYQVCEVSIGGGDPVCTDEIDEQCIATFDALELRVRAVFIGEDGVDATLLVGPARYEPVSLELRAGFIAVETDLGAALDAWNFAATVIEDIEGSDLGQVLSLAGRLRGELTITGPEAFTFEGAVLEAIAGSVNTDSGAVTFALGAADPMFTVSLDGVAETAAASIAMGALDLSAPLALLEPEATGNGLLALHLAGLSGAGALSEGDEAFALTDLGLGAATSTLSYGGVEIVGVDLNAELGRSFDLLVTPETATDSALLAVSPGVTLGLDWHLAPLAADLPDPTDVPDVLLDEVWTFSATGENGASVRPTSDGVAVVSGTMVLSSSTADAALSAEAGECLVHLDEPRLDESHELLASLDVIVCP